MEGWNRVRCDGVTEPSRGGREEASQGEGQSGKDLDASWKIGGWRD